MVSKRATVWLLLTTPLFAADPAYLSPLAIVAGQQGKTLYIAEHTANRVDALDIASGKVTAGYALPDPPGGLALSADGSQLYVTGASPAGKVYVIDLASGATVNEIAVGHTPVSPVVSPDGKLLYICNRFTNTVSVIDLAKGEETAVIPVPRQPADAALTPDGKWLLVTNLLPDGPANLDYVAAGVSIIDTGLKKLVKKVSLPTGSTAVHSICLSPDGRFAYAVHLRANFQLVTIRLNRGWMNTNVLSVIDVGEQKLVKTIPLDDRDRGAANPWDVATTEDGRHLVVTHAGTHEISVIDRADLHARLEKVPAEYMTPERKSGWHTALVPPDFSLLRGLRQRIALSGLGPRGMAVVGTTVYAAEYFSNSIGVVELSGGQKGKARSIALAEERPMTIERRGEFYFHDASQSFQNWQSCSTCHPSQGRPDGLNWDLLNDGVGNPKNVKSLLLSHQTPPAMISGVRDRAETAVRAGIKYILFVERPEADAEALDAYLKSLEPVASPYLADGKLSAAAERGKVLFQKARCAACHSGPLGTNMRLFDVGTGRGTEAKKKFDTPTLIEIWRTAPYLHDGRAATMKEVLTTENPRDTHGSTSRLSEQEIEDLAEYVLSL